jgi:hypothetical protein
MEYYVKSINSQQPPFLHSFILADRTKAKCAELYKMWKRDYPKGIGGYNVVAMKKTITGMIPMDQLEGKHWVAILTAIEKYYKKLDRTKRHGNSDPNVEDFLRYFLASL